MKKKIEMIIFRRKWVFLLEIEFLSKNCKIKFFLKKVDENMNYCANIFFQHNKNTRFPDYEIKRTKQYTIFQNKNGIVKKR